MYLHVEYIGMQFGQCHVWLCFPSSDFCTIIIVVLYAELTISNNSLECEPEVIKNCQFLVAGECLVHPV